MKSPIGFFSLIIHFSAQFSTRRSRHESRPDKSLSGHAQTSNLMTSTVAHTVLDDDEVFKIVFWYTSSYRLRSRRCIQNDSV
ncbi:hypothetical protein LCO01nite_16670 [Lapidilactobacillus concavus]|nr:hypothetical protein LCO01nite_16670 [Lapidilactobacillus concavus]